MALTAGDVPAIAGCYALPGLVVADTYSFSFTSPAAVALSFVGAAPDYQERELVAANARIEDVQPVSALLTDGGGASGSSWTASGRAVPGERYRYLLRTTELTVRPSAPSSGRPDRPGTSAWPTRFP